MKPIILILCLMLHTRIAEASSSPVIWGPNNSAILLQSSMGPKGAAALGFALSGGNFGNVGLGGAASASDAYPLLMQRTYSGLIYTQLGNPSTDAGSGSAFQVLSDNAANSMVISTFASASSAPDIYNGGGGVLRFSGSGSSTNLTLVADVSASSLIKFYVGGDATTNRALTLSATSANFQNDTHLIASAVTAPTITAGCGSSPTVSGSDVTGIVNVGTGGSATSCTVTFNKTWTTVPHCFIQDETSQAITTTVAPTATTMVITATAAWTASSKLDYFCINHQ